MFVSYVRSMLCRWWPLRQADHSYRGVLLAVCIIVCDLETSKMRRPRRLGCCAKEEEEKK
jgi:hypothetical protein